MQRHIGNTKKMCPQPIDSEGASPLPWKEGVNLRRMIAAIFLSQIRPFSRPPSHLWNSLIRRRLFHPRSPGSVSISDTILWIGRRPYHHDFSNTHSQSHSKGIGIWHCGSFRERGILYFFCGKQFSCTDAFPNGTMESVFHRRRNPHVILILLD